VCKNSIAEVRQDAFRPQRDQQKIDKKSLFRWPGTGFGIRPALTEDKGL
jgi:hypothetical protein